MLDELWGTKLFDQRLCCDTSQDASGDILERWNQMHAERRMSESGYKRTSLPINIAERDVKANVKKNQRETTQSQ